MNRQNGRKRWSPRLTKHAWKRMSGRGISPVAVDAVLHYGRTAYVRKASVHAIGRKEVLQLRKQGVDLKAYEGIQVVCSEDGMVITTYRNHDFRGLKPNSRTQQWSA